MKEYNLSDTSDSATAIIAYTIRAMNNSWIFKNASRSLYQND